MVIQATSQSRDRYTIFNHSSHHTLMASTMTRRGVGNLWIKLTFPFAVPSRYWGGCGMVPILSGFQSILPHGSWVSEIDKWTSAQFRWARTASPPQGKDQNSLHNSLKRKNRRSRIPIERRLTLTGCFTYDPAANGRPEGRSQRANPSHATMRNRSDPFRWVYLPSQ